MDIKNCFRLKLSDHIWVPTVLEWLPKLQSKMKLKYKIHYVKKINKFETKKFFGKNTQKVYYISILHKIDNNKK